MNVKNFVPHQANIFLIHKLLDENVQGAVIIAVIVSSVVTLTLTLAILSLVALFIRYFLGLFINHIHRNKLVDILVDQRWMRRNMMKVDRNPNFGMYYDANGDRIDQGVSEFVDANDYYR